MKLNPNKALVVFSGGQDSTTCLYWAFKKWGKENVTTVSFDYGQKHRIEIEAAKKITEMNHLDFDLVSIKDILRSSSPLVDLDAGLDFYESVSQFEPGLQKTFVPGRNILFLTIAANIAYSKQAANIVIGVCQEDYGGYYDCRQEFVTKMQVALNQGLFANDQGLVLHTPLMDLTKKQSVELAQKLGDDCLEALAYSHTCYNGEFPPCGKCHSCLLRQRGFDEAGLIDPMIKRSQDLAEC